MLPAQSPGASSIQQSIYLNLRRFIPSAGELICGNGRHTFKHILWRKQGSNLQPQGYDPCELPIAPFRYIQPHTRFYNAKISITPYIVVLISLFNRLLWISFFILTQR